MKYLISVIKYFTNLSAEKAIRFLLFSVICAEGYYILHLDKKYSNTISEFKEECRQSIMDCKIQLQNTIHQKDSVYRKYIELEREGFDKEISSLKKLLDKTEKLKYGN